MLVFGEKVSTRDQPVAGQRNRFRPASPYDESQDEQRSIAPGGSGRALRAHAMNGEAFIDVQSKRGIPSARDGIEAGDEPRTADGTVSQRDLTL